MKTIIIDGKNYNPKHVIYIYVDDDAVYLKFVDGSKFKLKMESKEEANEFKNDLMNSW